MSLKLSNLSEQQIPKSSGCLGSVCTMLLFLNESQQVQKEQWSCFSKTTGSCFYFLLMKDETPLCSLKKDILILLWNVTKQVIYTCPHKHHSRIPFQLHIEVSPLRNNQLPQTSPHRGMEVEPSPEEEEGGKTNKQTSQVLPIPKAFLGQNVTCMWSKIGNSPVQCHIFKTLHCSEIYQISYEQGLLKILAVGVQKLLAPLKMLLLLQHHQKK